MVFVLVNTPSVACNPPVVTTDDATVVAIPDPINAFVPESPVTCAATSVPPDTRRLLMVALPANTFVEPIVVKDTLPAVRVVNVTSAEANVEKDPAVPTNRVTVMLDAPKEVKLPVVANILAIVASPPAMVPVDATANAALVACAVPVTNNVPLDKVFAKLIVPNAPEVEASPEKDSVPTLAFVTPKACAFTKLKVAVVADTFVPRTVGAFTVVALIDPGKRVSDTNKEST